MQNGADIRSDIIIINLEPIVLWSQMDELKVLLKKKQFCTIFLYKNNFFFFSFV